MLFDLMANGGESILGKFQFGIYILGIRFFWENDPTKVKLFTFLRVLYDNVMIESFKLTLKRVKQLTIMIKLRLKALKLKI